MTKTNKTLEFDIILERLSGLALCERAKAKLLAIKPFLSERECKLKMDETTHAKQIIECLGTPPLASMKELDKIFDLATKGSMLIPEQFSTILLFISSSKRMKGYLAKAEILDVELALYGGSLADFSLLFEEIDRSIRNGAVDDSASPSLRDIRRKIENTKSAVKAKLETILRSKKEWFADSYVATRSGRFVLPVKKEYKNQVQGTTIDTSSTGSTCFIEPAAVRKLQEDLSVLQIDEDNEVRKILYTLTALVDENIAELKINMDCMETLDFIFAKAKLSNEMKAIPVPITAKRRIFIKQGRHPLLNSSKCIPLDFNIGEHFNGVVVTGPNTGGKTVALKTIGLLSLMAQSGLHVPAEEGSIFCLHSNILCDIGDGQSITENLSTFSAHITNIIAILKSVTNESLVLLDELGSGTDPAEGMGLAVAILDELKLKGGLFVATTHYPEIKDFAMNEEGIINARMEFDAQSLQPLYKLQIGEAGESCALFIARRLGFPEHMLKRAHSEAYGKKAVIKIPVREMEFLETQQDTINISTSRIIKDAPKSVLVGGESFCIGDSVTVFPQKDVGIIYKTANKVGELGVQIKGKKELINHKRIKLITKASELYPDNYDFSIVFDSVENRKARRVMTRKHDPNLIVRYEE